MAIFDRRRSDKANADALNRYLDDLASGVLAPRDEIDADTATIVSHWRQAGSHAAEPAGLRAQIWEDLMDSAPSLDPRALSAPPPPHGRSRHDILDRPGVPRTAQTEQVRHPVRWLAAALLLLGLVGWGVIGQVGGGSDPTPTAALLAPSAGTPVANEAPVVDGTPVAGGDSCLTLPNPYFTCPNMVHTLGTAFIWPPELLGNNEHQVQLQGWAITPGSTLPGVENGAASGMVVDFVINGMYVATFDVPVVVIPGGITNDAIQYLDAGDLVELSRGDAVSYELGGLIEIRNPLSVQRLEFKRGVIYDGDISPFSATTDGVTNRVEGNTILPAATGSKPRQMTLWLGYVQILPGIPFPPESMGALATVGPVDPQRGPAGTEGFVLLITPTRG